MSVAPPLPAETVPEAAIDADSRYEVVDGQNVEKPPMGNLQIVVNSFLFERLAPFARLHGFGRVLAEVLLKINLPDGPLRRPDLAFFSNERWPRSMKVNSDNGFEVVPDLAIEVISPSNSADEVNQKIREYFKAGVRQVWVVYPASRLVHIYETPKKSIILDITDELDGGDLLPGFRLSLAELFEDAADV